MSELRWKLKTRKGVPLRVGEKRRLRAVGRHRVFRVAPRDQSSVCLDQNGGRGEVDNATHLSNG